MTAPRHYCRRVGGAVTFGAVDECPECGDPRATHPRIRDDECGAYAPCPRSRPLRRPRGPRLHGQLRRDRDCDGFLDRGAAAAAVGAAATTLASHGYNVLVVSLADEEMRRIRLEELRDAS